MRVPAVILVKEERSPQPLLRGVVEEEHLHLQIVLDFPGIEGVLRRSVELKSTLHSIVIVNFCSIEIMARDVQTACIGEEHLDPVQGSVHSAN